MTLLLFFEVKDIIEEQYEKQINYYKYANPPLAARAERELKDWKKKVSEIMGLD